MRKGGQLPGVEGGAIQSNEMVIEDVHLGDEEEYDEEEEENQEQDHGGDQEEFNGEDIVHDIDMEGEHIVNVGQQPEQDEEDL